MTMTIDMLTVTTTIRTSFFNPTAQLILIVTVHTVSHSGRVCMCTACAGDAVCRLCGAHTAHVSGVALCAIVMTATALTLNGYDCRATCDCDVADDDACADNDYDCNDADHVR